MSSLLINNVYLVQFTPSILENMSILIEDGLIQDIFKTDSKKYQANQTIDGNHMYALPGFVNAHTHSYSSLIRGFSKIKESETFQKQLENLWWKLDKNLFSEDIYYSAMLIAIDSIKNGTTCLFDHHSSPGYVTGSLEIIKKVFENFGLKSCLCYELSDRDGQIISDKAIKENLDIIGQCSNSKLTKGMFGLHASNTITDKTFEKVAYFTNDINCGYHIHVAEAKSDQNITMEKYHKSVIKRLYDFNILKPQSIAAHCVHLEYQEYDLLSETDTMVVHNPQSNLNNAVGIADLLKLFSQNIIVGLGTDAMTTNMLEELKFALFAQHLKQNHPTCAFNEVISTLFKNNYKIAKRIFGQSFGDFSIGSPADIIMFDYKPPTPLDEESLFGHLIYGFSQTPVNSTIVNGKLLMHNRIIQGIDIDEVMSKSRICSKKLWKNIV